LLEIEMKLEHFRGQSRNQFIAYQEEGLDEEHFFFAVAEAIFVGWFTIEYVLRFIASPQKWM
jgi:hypothetical protein